MAATTFSPPETPRRKGAPEVNNDTPKRPATKAAMLPPSRNTQLGEETNPIEVGFTQPPESQSQESQPQDAQGYGQEQESQLQQSQQQEPQVQNSLTQENEIAGQEVESETETERGFTNEPLSAFNWEEFEKRYMQALVAADTEESELVEEFEEISEAFYIWAETSADRENMIAQKRLKIREIHIRNSELELEEKKAHYSSVVDAFRQAMSLLTAKIPAPTPRRSPVPRTGGC